MVFVKARTIILSVVFILILGLGIMTTNQYLKANELKNTMLSCQNSLSIALTNRNTQMNTLTELVQKQQVPLSDSGSIAVLQTAQASIEYYQSKPNESSPHDVYQSNKAVGNSFDTLLAAIPEDSSILNDTGYQTAVKEIRNLNSLIEDNFNTYNRTAFDYNHEIDNFPILLFYLFTGFSQVSYYA